MFLFGGSKKNEASVGVDIGTTSVKATELVSTGANTYALTNYASLEVSGHLDHFNNALQSSNLRPLDSDLVSYLGALRAKAGFQTNHVTASIPPFSSFTTLLEMPVESGSPNASSLILQVKDFIPFPVSEVTLSWNEVGVKTYPDGTKKKQIFLVSTPNEKIESYTSIFGRAGFILDGIEIENIAIARFLARDITTPALIIDIGGRSTSFTIAYGGKAYFAGQTDFSSSSLTQALATALNISPRRADALKRDTPIVGGTGGHELSTILIPIIDVIITEAGRARTGFEAAFDSKIDRVLLTGSGASMPGFPAYLAQQMNLPVTGTEFPSWITLPSEIIPLQKQLGNTFGVCIGLALKKFSN